MSEPDFIQAQGLALLAHVLRRLSDEFVRGFEAWCIEAGVAAPPRTHSTLLALETHGVLSVTELAALIRQSHPLAITWVRQLQALGFVVSETDLADRRRTVLALSESGRRQVRIVRRTLEVSERAYATLLKEADSDLFDALWRVEAACRTKPFEDRLRAAMQQSDDVTEA